MICASVVSHGQSEVASNLLDCLATVAPGLISQVIFTRNIPEPGAPPPRADLPGLVVIDNAERKGFGANHNAAFQLCRAPFFCVLNPDISWSADPFAALLACFSEPDGALQPEPSGKEQRAGPGDRSAPLGLVAPRVLSPNGRVENTGRLLYTVSEMISQKLAPQNHGDDAEWLAGMFLLFRSEAYRAIGGFDEGYFLYIEDVDICSRLRLAGWRLRQCPAASVIHDARNTSHRSPRYAVWHLQGMLRYWRSRGFWRYRAMLARQRDA